MRRNRAQQASLSLLTCAQQTLFHGISTKSENHERMWAYLDTPRRMSVGSYKARRNPQNPPRASVSFSLAYAIRGHPQRIKMQDMELPEMESRNAEGEEEGVIEEREGGQHKNMCGE